MDINKIKYNFYPYSRSFPLAFANEKRKLRILLRKVINVILVEHIGSTSVEGLGGKGVIDILIAVLEKDIKKVRRKLISSGYKTDPKHGNSERFYFYKEYKDKKKIREVHLHLTFYNSYSWVAGLAVRDFLRKHRKFRDEYEKIKKQGVKKAKGSGEKYRKHKHDFLQKITKKALTEFNKPIKN